MTGSWRYWPAILIAPVVVLPVIGPFLVAFRTNHGHSPVDFYRLLPLLGQSLILMLCTAIIAVPIGVTWALLLSRCRVRGQSALIATALFLPLPVTAIAWQAILGEWLPSLTLDPGQVAWRPWNTGLLPAAWVHACAAIPWVVLISVSLLHRTDPGLEDDVRMSGRWRYLLLPRLTLAAIASVAWIGVQTFTEIPITDAMMVRTFAEEVYVQLVHGESAVTTAIIATIPLGLGIALIGWILSRRLRQRMGKPSTEILPRSQRQSGLWPSVVAWLFVSLFIFLPLGALAWKATSGGTGFSAIRDVLRTTGISLILSLFASLATGLIVATLAWLAVIHAMKSRAFMLISVIVSAWFLVLPAPILGLGLKESINILMDVESHFPLGEFPPMRSALYDQSSPLPVMWAAGLRFFPLACLILWPAMRAIPRGLWEAAAIDGHTGWRLWKLVLIPHAGRAWLSAVVAVAALSLGEVSAGKLVNPPFYDVYILQLFSQMHYGTESSVAAMSLLPAIIVGILAIVWSRLMGVQREASLE